MKKLFVMMAALVAMTGVAKAEDVIITVDVSDQIMLVETPTDYYEWNVSTGRKGYNTPRGVFQPYHMVKMHYSRKYDNAPMPNSIFFLDGYAIHATEDLKRLGRPASHGCIRLHPQNAKWLYRIVSEYGKENTTILIVD
jgi:lipoprotein-anchoring transpeptidase ErfK/SrfK